MKQKKYEKPSIEVVKLQASVAMLAGSGVTGSNTGSRTGYNSTEEQTWGE